MASSSGPSGHGSEPARIRERIRQRENEIYFVLAFTEWKK